MTSASTCERMPGRWRCTVGPMAAARAMELADGEHVPADLVLLTVGVQPRTALAAEAGLPVDRGVVVGTDLRSPGDPRVAAIGDCAQPAAGCPGPTWPGSSRPAGSRRSCWPV